MCNNQCLRKPHKTSLFNDDYLISEGNFDQNLYSEYLAESVRWVEDYIVDELIGPCLYNKLQEQICSGELEPCMETLLDYLLPIYIYGLKAELPMSITYKEKNGGLLKTVDPAGTYEVAQMSEIVANEQRWTSKKNYYVLRCRKYILCSGCFNGYRCCPSLISRDTIFGISVTETDPRYIASKYSRYYNKCCRGGLGYVL